MHASNEEEHIGTEQQHLPNGCPANKRFYQHLIQCAPNVILFLSPDHLILEFNPEAERLYGRKREDVLGKDYFEEFLPDDTREAVTADFGKVLTGKPTRGFENAVVTNDGQERILRWNIDSVLDSENKSIGIVAVGQDITKHKQAELTLRKSEEKYRTLFESANDAIFALEVDNNSLHFKECNSRIMDMFRCRREDIIGKSPVDFSPSVQPDGTLSTERVAQLCAASMAGEPQHFEWKHCRLDGTEFDVEVTLNRVDIAGKTCLQAIVRDITERKQAEEALHESENRYRTVVENAGEGIVIAQERTLKFINPHFTDITGYSEEEFMSRPFIEFVHPDDREQVMEIHMKRLKGEEVPHAYEFRAIHKKGNTMWLENNGISIEWDGRPASLNFLRDITDRKDAEQKIKSSEERFKVLFEYAPDAYYMTDLQGRFVDGNLAAEQTIGYKREELIGKSFLKLKLLSLGQIPKAAKLLAKSALGQPTGPDEFVLNRKDGTKVDVEIRTYPVQINGQALILGIARDITERKKAEETLKTERDKLQALMDGITRAGIGIDIIGTDYKVLFQNKTLEERFGKLSGKPCYEHYMAQEKSCDRCSVTEVIKQNAAVEIEQRGLDGKDYQIFTAPVPGADGSVNKAIEIVLDITERKQAEEALKESEERSRSLSEAAFEGIAISERGVLVDANDAFVRMYGCSLEELKGKQVIELVAPEYRKIVTENIRSGYEGVYEHKGLRKDGSLIDLEIHGSNIIYQGRNMRLTAIRDITEQKKARLALEAEKKFTENAINAQMDTFFLFEPETGKAIRWNKTFTDISGYTDEEITRMPTPSSYYSPEDLEHAGVFIQKVLKEGAGAIELELICKDGRKIPTEYRVSVINNDQGEPKYIISIGRDITERKLAEDKLRESEERLTKAFRASPNLMGIIDLDERRRLLVNEAFARVTGYSIEEATGTTFDELNFWVESGWLHEALQSIRQDGVLQGYETDIRTKQGEIRTLRYYAALLDIPGNDLVMFSAEDITEHRKAERRIQEYQVQLKSLASELSLAEERERRRIAAGIHDDIAQKLAMAKFELQSLQASVTDTDVSGSLEKQCQLMDQVVADARSLTFELSNPVLYQVGLEAAVESYLTERIQGQFGIKCKFKSEGPRSSLEEDIRVVLFQAVRELLANIVKHANASTVEVCVSNTEDRLRIVVQDDGVGFDSTEIGPHLVGRGGFGLFNIRERLEYLGGNVKIESRRTRGARVIMTVAMKTNAAAE